MSRRLDIVDALRGSALLGILLLHSVEHWDFLHLPEHQPEWLATLDRHAIEWGYLLFGGKAYAIFALLFGVSFFITLDSWKARSRSACGRFLWRLVVLGGLGYLHGLLYCGDILTVIAALGVPLVLLNRLGSRALGMVAGALRPEQCRTEVEVLDGFTKSMREAYPDWSPMPGCLGFQWMRAKLMALRSIVRRSLPRRTMMWRSVRVNSSSLLHQRGR